MIDEGVRQGYCGGVLHAFSSEKLRVAVEAAALGLVCMDARVAPMPAFDDDANSEPGAPALIVREAEGACAAHHGRFQKEIARRLDISVHTAKSSCRFHRQQAGADGAHRGWLGRCDQPAR